MESLSRRIVRGCVSQAGKYAQRRLQQEECRKGRYQPIPSFHLFTKAGHPSTLKQCN